MQVELGNTRSKLVTEERTAPTVLYIGIPDVYTYEVGEPGAVMRIGRGNDVDIASAPELAAHATDHISKALLFNDGIYHMPGQEALLAVFEHWRSDGTGVPLWVWSDNDDFAKLLGEFFGCPVGRPDDVEATHHTDSGPPGVGVDRVERAEAAAAIAQADRPNLED